MITLITCLTIAAGLLFLYAVVGIHRESKRGRREMRLAAAIYSQDHLTDREADELNRERWDGD